MGATFFFFFVPDKQEEEEDWGGEEEKKPQLQEPWQINPLECGPAWNVHEKLASPFTFVRNRQYYLTIPYTYIPYFPLFLSLSLFLAR